MVNAHLSTGLTGLDDLLRGLIAGDNIVWQVESIEDYLEFVIPYAENALLKGKKLVYFRFASHVQLIDEDMGAEICELNPQAGFESFLETIHNTIRRQGKGAFYIFDCLSELSADWYSDQMLGNFFMLTCPYLYDLETITYFALFRGNHSMNATEPILNTTQLFLDVYRHKGKLYLQPLKVQQRSSPTMFMLHVWGKEGFFPVTESYTNAQVLASSSKFGLNHVHRRLGPWTRALLKAEETLERVRSGEESPETAIETFKKLLRMSISRDERVLKLVEKYFDLEEVLSILQRMIGTGLIGGKSVGMLLARNILKKEEPQWKDLLEVHDSFYIASDVFYTYLVRNGCWWIRQKLRDPEHYLDDVYSARRRILTGTFPEQTVRQFESMLDYFGQLPIIVRSSSLLEDNFGNAFAGKYESIFCANQGSRHQRLENFISAVKMVYASALSDQALKYRKRRGMLDRDEQMALLVQRVSGDIDGHYFFPHIAGVALSFNPYVWSEDIDPEAGILRLVFGLGTRAVDRSDDDYTRLVALNAPDRLPEGSSGDVPQHMQRKVDLLDLEGNMLITKDFLDVAHETKKVPMALFASRNPRLEREARQRGLAGGRSLMLSFKHLLKNTDFVDKMSEMLKTIHKAYDYPVDVEFTANFIDDNNYSIDIVQCRPFQVKGSTVIVEPPENIATEDLILETAGPVIGQSRIEIIDRIVYVVPSLYGELPLKERHSVARVIGNLLRVEEERKREHILLLGPGRWGTSSPELGVPVAFAEICNVSMLCEIVAMREDLVPDVSMGTHFFGELVEMDMLYLALFPDKEKNFLNTDFFEKSTNVFSELLPNDSRYSNIVRVIDIDSFNCHKVLRLYSDTLKQKVICYFDASVDSKT